MAKVRQSSKEDRMLVRISTFFISQWKAGLAIWLTILLAGAYIYTGVISREGFPPISFPISFISGTYFVDDAQRVDAEITKPISDAISGMESIAGVEAEANGNFFTVAVVFDESLTSAEGTKLVRDTIESSVQLPPQAQLNYSAIDPGSFLFEYDMLVQVYSTSGDSIKAIDDASVFVADQLESLSMVDRADEKQNTQTAVNPLSGEEGLFQTNFNRVGVPAHGSDEIDFFNATTIGIDRVAGEDIIELSEAVQAKLAELDLSEFGTGLETQIGADFAVDIENQINFLETNMLTGLIAVALVSLLLITWRASIITALFMLSVMVSTIITLYVIGYTLNTITLFALILSLGLFVDDATIVVEAIDVSKRQKKLSTRGVIAEAVKRVGAASLSGTLTTVLVFAILATPTGILGEFIRLIPITVVIALILSFMLSITLIPLLSKFIILKHRQPSWLTVHNPILKLEEWMGTAIQGNILKMKTGKGKIHAFVALSLSAAMIMSGLYIFGLKVDQNTFPPAKDSNQVAVEISFPPGTDINTAKATASQVESLVSQTVGEEITGTIYGLEQLSDSQRAVLSINLIPFTERDIKAPVLVARVEAALEEANIPATTAVGQVDNGPPGDQFPFGIRVASEDVELLQAVTADIAKSLVGQELENYNGDKINVLDSRILGVDNQVLRDKGERFAITKFSYDSNNPTIVTLLTEERFEELYDDERLAAIGTSAEDIGFDAGQEGEFQDSFATLVLAIPIAMLLMYVLLAVQFKSILQPFLILLAIPFTIFGVAAGLYVTDNAASFFALTGFIGLIGIAVNNTIMLTDYANQERRSGKGAIEAIANASRKRLRPLIATSITTVVALLPLALSDPFWEALAFTIIFGLLSSTFLVIISFPYYYLLLEAVRRKVLKLFRRA